VTIDMPYISLYSGIGGIDLGFDRAGMRCVAQVEKDPYCLRVLEKHWPDVMRFDNDETVGRHNLPAARLICGGPPCQPFSTAGQRRGADDPRNRWPQMRRIISEVRPDWVVFENVPGIIHLYLDTVVDEMEAEGYEVAPPVVFPVASLGASHIRQRVWIVAHAHSGHDARTSSIRTGGILSERSGVQMADPKSAGRIWDREQRGEPSQVQIWADADGSCEVVANPKCYGWQQGAENIFGREPSSALCCKDGRGVALGNASSQGFPDGAGFALEERSSISQPERPGGGNGRSIPDPQRTQWRQETEGRYEPDGENTRRQEAAGWPGERSQYGRAIWPPEPGVGRVAHGVPRRVDRLRGLGNAVSPAQSYHVGRLIMAVEEMIHGGSS